MATQEKEEPTHLDNGNVSPPVETEKKLVLDNRFRDLPPDPDEGLSEEDKAKIDRQLLWRLDRKLIPWLCLLYLISFLDSMRMPICSKPNIDSRQEQILEMQNLRDCRRISIYQAMERSTILL